MLKCLEELKEHSEKRYENTLYICVKILENVKNEKIKAEVINTKSSLLKTELGLNRKLQL